MEKGIKFKRVKKNNKEPQVVRMFNSLDYSIKELNAYVDRKADGTVPAEVEQVFRDFVLQFPASKTGEWLGFREFLQGLSDSAESDDIKGFFKELLSDYEKRLSVLFDFMSKAGVITSEQKDCAEGYLNGDVTVSAFREGCLDKGIRVP